MHCFKFILIIVLMLFVCGCEKKTVLFECKDLIGCVDVGSDESLQIGVVQALSGKVATLGKEQIRGFELALDERQGKLSGHSVHLQIEDTGCTAEGGANAVLKIIADPQNIAIFGTTCSGAAATASKAMSEAGLTMISGNNSAPFLTSITDKRAPSWQSGYFRTSSNEENSGKAAAIYAYNKLGIRKAATINDGDIYTRGLTEGFNKAFLSLGGQVVLDTSVNKGDIQMAPVLRAVLNAKAELLFFPLFQPEGNYILLNAREFPGFKKITLMSDGALINSSFLTEIGDEGLGLYFVGPAAPTGRGVDLLEQKYKTKFKVSPSVSYYLQAYDAANLLFNSIEKVAVIDADGSIHIGRQDLRDALYDIENFTGVTGSLSCDEFGDCGFPVFNVLQLENVIAGLSGLMTNVKFIYSPSKLE